jgi:formylglycine-generating enzyme required for sulfatase activity
MKVAIGVCVFCLVAFASGHGWTADLALIKGGTFAMGSPDSENRREKDEKRRQVTVGDFRLARREVTQAEFQEIMGNNPSNFQGGDLPVENVSWFEAIRYRNALSLKEGLTPAYSLSGPDDRPIVTWNREANGYRLPTEAEWEYACRAGTVTPFNTGENVTTDQANYYGSYPYDNYPRGEYRSRTVPVGGLPPNAWGLYETHGNVWEWCWDWYGEYEAENRTYPTGTTSGDYRVNRGGGWYDFRRHLRSAYRAAHPPEGRTFNLGFRLARDAD